MFLWLAQLSPLVGLFTDPEHIKSKSLSDNCGKSNGNISNRVGGKELVMKEKLVTEKKLEIEEKLETEEEMEIEDLKGPE